MAEYIVEFPLTVNSEPPKQTTFEELGYVQVVRCKDCKHYNIIGCSEGFGWCEKYRNGHTDDWFCADGERK